METVYIVLIVSVAIISLTAIIILRNRITKAKIDFSIKDQKASMELGASKPNAKTDNTPSAPLKPIARSGFVGNVAEWWSHIRVPEGARVVNNKASVGSTIEVQERSKEQAGHEGEE